jgi:hypothetical protein
MMSIAAPMAADLASVPGSSTPLSRTDAEGNTYRRRSLPDGSVHELLKNFPAADAAIAALGPRAASPIWGTWQHDWALSWTLASS